MEADGRRGSARKPPYGFGRPDDAYLFATEPLGDPLFPVPLLVIGLGHPFALLWRGCLACGFSRHRPLHHLEKRLAKPFDRESAKAAAGAKLGGGARQAAHDLAKRTVSRCAAGRSEAELVRARVSRLGERPQDG
eukprot:2919097-Prymnesium_polylepis.2